MYDFCLVKPNFSTTTQSKLLKRKCQLTVRTIEYNTEASVRPVPLIVFYGDVTGRSFRALAFNNPALNIACL
jgi:hypothetical protein